MSMRCWPAWGVGLIMGAQRVREYLFMTEEEKKKWGGARPGSGAPKKPDDKKMVIKKVSARPEQWEKFKKLGGSKWFREKIDQSEI